MAELVDVFHRLSLLFQGIGKLLRLDGDRVALLPMESAENTNSRGPNFEVVTVTKIYFFFLSARYIPRRMRAVPSNR